MLRFKAEIRILGVNPYVTVSSVRANKLKSDWRKPMPVLVKINGHPKESWRINMMPKGDGSFYLYLHESVRKRSKTKVGDMVMVEVIFDSTYKSGPDALPVWFRSELKKNSAAHKKWRSLAPSRQKEIVRYLSRLKSKDAQQRNLEKAIRMLEGKPGRWIGRTAI